MKAIGYSLLAIGGLVSVGTIIHLATAKKNAPGENLAAELDPEDFIIPITDSPTAREVEMLAEDLRAKEAGIQYTQFMAQRAV